MDETEELIRLCNRALAAQMHAAPGIELHMTRDAVLGLTDEPTPDFNRLMLGDHPAGEAFLAWATSRARERDRPLVATLTPRAAQALGPAAERLGYAQVATSPLMVLRPRTPVAPGRPVKVVRALGPELVGMAGDLVSAAFDEPRDVVARCLDVCVTPTAGLETYVAFDDDGQPVSAVTLTPTGDTAGVSQMATPPDRQRQGWGRALLTAVIEDYRRRGVTRFHLGATDAGRPLYDSLGFEKVADLSVWLLAGG